jgi:hypothetical protein
MSKPLSLRMNTRWLGCVSILMAAQAGPLPSGAAATIASAVPAETPGPSQPAGPAETPEAAPDPEAVKELPQDDAHRQAPRTARLNPADLEGWAALGGGFLSPKGSIERYYSQVSEKALATLRGHAAQRAAVEEAANKAADEVRARADDARRKVLSGSPDPDDSPELAAEKRRALLAAFDAKTDGNVKTARQKVLDDARAAQRYVDSAQAQADLRATLDALYARVDAVYTEGITQAVEKLSAEYALAGSARRNSAETLSGYEGRYYKVERVDRYFKENWRGEMEPLAIETCKAALGFKMGGDGGNFKDPSVENVDKICGVRDGLISLLVSYKGSNKLPARRK